MNFALPPASQSNLTIPKASAAPLAKMKIEEPFVCIHLRIAKLCNPFPLTTLTKTPGCAPSPLVTPLFSMTRVSCEATWHCSSCVQSPEDIVCQLCAPPEGNGGWRQWEVARAAGYTQFAHVATALAFGDVGDSKSLPTISSFPQARLLLRSLSLIQNRVE
jgi:hypothetical protein